MRAGTLGPPSNCCSSASVAASDSAPPKTLTLKVLLLLLEGGDPQRLPSRRRWLPVNGRMQEVGHCLEQLPSSGCQYLHRFVLEPQWCWLQAAAPPKIFSLPVRLILRNQSSPGLHDCVKVC